MARSTVNTNPNANLSLSGDARRRMRNQREGVVRGYYNDGHGNHGHCSYGIGILVHRGPCTPEELARPLTSAQIEASFANAIREAECAVLRRVTNQALTQAQFDALVSYSFNTGARGANETFQRVDSGDLRGAANSIMSNTYSTQNGRRVFMPGLVSRRREESAPFLEGQ
ncbi:GH24 family phage-related lysozyme (muramidase) [Duganella sp. 1411]|uniref:lysozyme n=1 Tax=Duganella sp. 1411 TaxID=2806572 RepID=UPI001AE73F63|nr:glycoside hydrolase family protein [Duganella sp. 1411]MBP1206199.1 GH24 family phage-related lysozyme (muramidase) [Duganella sp. 1411]